MDCALLLCNVLKHSGRIAFLIPTLENITPGSWDPKYENTLLQLQLLHQEDRDLVPLFAGPTSALTSG